MKSDNRRAVRLKVDGGVVVLHAPGFPSFAWQLSDLSESGCRCSASVRSVHAALADAWSSLLTPGTQVQAAISHPPQLQNFVIGASVTRGAKQTPDEIQAGLKFLGTPPQREALRNVLMKMAARKVRKALPKIAEAQHASEVPASPEESKRHPLLNASDLRDAMMLDSDSVAATEDGDANTRLESKVGALLLRNPEVTAEDLCHALSIESGLPVINLDIRESKIASKNPFSYLTMLRFKFAPFADSKEMICVAAAVPLSTATVNELEKIAGRHVQVFLAPADQIHSLQYRSRPRMKNQERRYPRIAAAIPATYRFHDGKVGAKTSGASREGTTLNISQAGALLTGLAESELRFSDFDEHSKLRICLDPATRAVSATARVLYVKSDAKNRWLYGLEWSGMSGKELSTLTEYLKSLTVVYMKNRSRGAGPA